MLLAHREDNDNNGDGVDEPPTTILAFLKRPCRQAGMQRHCLLSFVSKKEVVALEEGSFL